MQSPLGYYDQIKSFLENRLWRADIESMALPQRYGYKFVRFLFVLMREFANGQLNLRAMSLVYTTLLSMVPLLAVSFSVLKAFGVHNQIEPLLLNLVQPLGEKGNEIVVNLLGFVENMKVGVLGSVGLALLLYTVVSLIQKVESSFNYVWHAKSTRPFSRRFSDYLSVIMVGPVLMFSAIGMTASLMNSDVVQALVSIEPFGSIMLVVTKLIPFLLIIMAFTFVYMFMPNTRVKFTAALVGAVVGGALWQSTGLVFAEFASSSTKYAAIYSGFAILVLFMIWLYLSWFILLLGSQVAYYVQYPEQIRLSNQRVPLSGRLREQTALLTIYWIAHRFVRHKKPLSIEELCQLLAIPAERVTETVQMLMDRELVVETNDEPSTYVLQSDPANMTVAEFLQIVRRPNDEQSMMNDQIQSVGGVDEVMAQLESSVGEKLAGLTLRKLVDDGKPD
ncbi:MAG: YihY/virulence factor BrkB family protein [Porticoccus sp.]|jgi:membrane protein|uniref:YihY/virulence factor BrkB family protein n=1 Tax=Porticoccus TaxID=1123967 RepID=UPI00055C32E8|nr:MULTISPECIES: YihY/virulence factor BrkB family protein [Porticoccus]MAZ70452.1 YihY/virulence factor BrkB family protein [Porticoccus sp.]MBG58169.1 YihY/virulence factor BrkB family protein [Porticoccus sp.]|tara:strand:- start:351 stop:1697 length:1347 start_codon:yes stop_codon:yes gene_type:complete